MASKARLKALEKRNGCVEIEAVVDLKADKTRFEERMEGGRKIITMILNKDDAGVL